MAEVTYREAMSAVLAEYLEKDDRVFIMGEDIGAYGGSYAVTKGFLERYGEERIRDAPIAESVIAGAGLGAALGGMRPIVELMTINFSLLAMDQIVNHAAKLRYMSGGQFSIPLVIRTVSGGGNRLGAQHSQSLEGWYAHVPGLKVAVPSSPYDAKGLFRAAMEDNNPVLFVEHSLLYGVRGEVPEGYYEVPLGRSALSRQGTDVTVVSYSRMAHLCRQVAEKLAGEGVSCEVVDLRCLRPLDLAPVFQSVTKTHRVVLVEETWATGGFMGEVASQIMTQAFDHLDAPVVRVAGKEVPMPYSRPLELAALPDEESIAQAIRDILA
ncbi:MAG: alpha-ketoacid dehydrogenase subunit beta [Dehalococcoidia bacterium]|nr:alpha-ketoacid dehydrogenase subunit beta [Dehalococcoidia bacterium]